jgi:hypothetical protein
LAQSLPLPTLFTSRLYRLACAVVSVFPVVIAVASWHDGTWRMDQARGFSQHYGYWTIFASAPLLAFLTAWLGKVFAATIRDIDGYCANLTEDTRAHLNRLVQRHLDSLGLRARSAWILAFLVLVLLFWWLFNVVKTITPIATYGHDVFDAYDHPFGFYAAKAYTLLLFSLVYSVAIFVSLHVTVSLISILRFADQHNVLRINLFHADNCAGTSRFGNINLLVLGIYAQFFLVDYAMYLTHRRPYLALVASLTAACALAVTQSVVAVYSIHTTVARTKRAYVEAMTIQLHARVADSLAGNSAFPSDLLAVRDRLLGVHTFPYAAETLVVVNALRFAPAALAVLSYFKG